MENLLKEAHNKTDSYIKSPMIKKRAVLLVSSNIDSEIVKKGDIAICTTIITNQGLSIAENIIFSANIYEGADFIQGSLSLNFNFEEDIDIEHINIGDIKPGESKVLSFELLILESAKLFIGFVPKVTYNSKDSINNSAYCSESNLVKSKIEVEEIQECFLKNLSSKLKLYLKANYTSVTIDDIVTFSLSIENNFEDDIYDTIVKVNLSEYLEFVEGSVKIFESEFSSLDIVKGIEIECLKRNEIQSINFKAKVLKNKVSVLENFSVLECVFLDQENNKNTNLNIKSNTNKIMLEKTNITIKKTSNKINANLLDVVDYNILIRNIGSVVVFNICLEIEKCESLELVKNSITLNGNLIEVENSKNIIAINELYVKETAIITYKMKVIAGAKKCQYNIYAIYEYKLSNGRYGKKETEKVSSVIYIDTKSFKYIVLDTLIYTNKFANKVVSVDSINVESQILEKYIIQSKKGISNEGKVLSGKSLIVNGIITLIIEYTSSNGNVFCEFFKKNISTDIIVPVDYKKNEVDKIICEVENLNSTFIDDSCVSVSLIILLSVGENLNNNFLIE